MRLHATKNNNKSGKKVTVATTSASSASAAAGRSRAGDLKRDLGSLLTEVAKLQFNKGFPLTNPSSSSSSSTQSTTTTTSLGSRSSGSAGSGAEESPPTVKKVSSVSPSTWENDPMLQSPLFSSLEEHIQVIALAMVEERDSPLTWKQKVKQSVSSVKAQRRHLELSYDYLAPSALFAIDLPFHPTRRESQLDRSLRQWWMAAKKWRLLTGRWALLDHVLNTFDLLAYAHQVLLNTTTTTTTAVNSTVDTAWVRKSSTSSSSSSGRLTTEEVIWQMLPSTMAERRNPAEEMEDKAFVRRIITAIERSVEEYLAKHPHNHATILAQPLPRGGGGGGRGGGRGNYNEQLLYLNNLTATASLLRNVLYEDGLLLPSSSSTTHLLDTVLLKIIQQESLSRTAQLIAIGDIHGCVQEIVDLLRNASFAPGDLVVSLGDMVAKGPFSSLAIQLMLDIQGVAVRGNHEQSVIFEGLIYANQPMDSSDPSTSSTSSSTSSTSTSSATSNSTEHGRIARSLTFEQFLFLCKLPYYIRSDDLGVLFVHAGFDVNHELHRQVSWKMLSIRHAKNGPVVKRLLEKVHKTTATAATTTTTSAPSTTATSSPSRMIYDDSMDDYEEEEHEEDDDEREEEGQSEQTSRKRKWTKSGSGGGGSGVVAMEVEEEEEEDGEESIHSSTTTTTHTESSSSSGGRSRPRWAEVWPGPWKVYFGHDSQHGLRYYSNAVCLDSACVYGSSLSAVLLPQEEIISVPARRVYYVFPHTSK